MARPQPANTLPPIQRHITGHAADGTSVFLPTPPARAEWEHIKNDDDSRLASFFLAYTTLGFPVDLNAPRADAPPADLALYEQHLRDPPRSLAQDNASVLRYVDFPPAMTPFMHRTNSIDYGIVLEGEIELLLDSGATRRLRRGDVCVQRATMHAWRNPSDHAWARMVFILISSTPPALAASTSSTPLPDLSTEKSHL
ncbi:BgTH12-02857 [Blumeria graminis f. sp. triticale]|uniref:BgTH12-02857 n=1 Tax=Blumeria graminis f. sp. triticale TaxID=1689686 RepID=A0A9W4DK28_BLUGR|nr:hypothetical protein BGT96224_4218 [Blumeria graminis f. sp. tritici 96224]CAD6503189.1 BgTH12-02857 [Blumeria graminis f. sp. triticale]